MSDSSRAALYIRVSTDKQDALNQLPALLAMAKARGCADPVVFEETAGGASEKRPVLDSLLEEARRGRFGVVYVWALDRLSRKGPIHLVGLLRTLHERGVRLVSHQESWLDGSGPVVELMLLIFGWVAAQERARLRERTLAGLERARAQGKRLGAPRAPAPLLEAAAALVDAGMPVSRAAAEVGRGRCGRAPCATCREKGGHPISARTLSRHLAARQKPPAGPAPGGDVVTRV